MQLKLLVKKMECHENYSTQKEMRTILGFDLKPLEDEVHEMQEKQWARMQERVTALASWDSDSHSQLLLASSSASTAACNSIASMSYTHYSCVILRYLS